MKETTKFLGRALARDLVVTLLQAMAFWLAFVFLLSLWIILSLSVGIVFATVCVAMILSKTVSSIAPYLKRRRKKREERDSELFARLVEIYDSEASG